jgi:hypothetical protein
MTDQEKEYLEALYAGFAMIGFIINGNYSPEEIPSRSKALAKQMIQEPLEGGIVAIKRKTKK